MKTSTSNSTVPQFLQGEAGSPDCKLTTRALSHPCNMSPKFAESLLGLVSGTLTGGKEGMKKGHRKAEIAAAP